MMDANTEKKLSKWGFRVYMSVVVVMMLYFLGEMVTNTGVASWLIKVQLDLFNDGYYPVLTMLLLLLPVQAVAFPAGFLFDYLTDQGIFAPAPQDPTVGSVE